VIQFARLRSTDPHQGNYLYFCLHCRVGLRGDDGLICGHGGDRVLHLRDYGYSHLSLGRAQTNEYLSSGADSFESS
jgi:hypothetical protein